MSTDVLVNRLELRAEALTDRRGTLIFEEGVVL